jgi:hypothetical protein
MSDKSSDMKKTQIFTIGPKTVLIITPDGRLEAGEGLSNDEVSRELFKICSTYYGTRTAELERENAALRELTSTLGAPNHINIPVEKWRELREDKERLDWVIKDSYYHFFFKLSSDLEKGRRQIDAARKEAQP